MATAVAYHLPSAVSNLALEPDPLARASAVMERALRAAASSVGAVAVGVRAALHCWSVQLRSAQRLPCGRWYVESCPSYLATVDGCTRWAAGLAWMLARRVVGWWEASTEQARALGVQLRRVKWGSRYGRHLVLNDWQLAALRAACGQTACPAQVVLEGAEVLARFARGARTASVHCPMHDDSTPSLVLWANGGAQCMACQQGDGTAPRWAWVARGTQLHLLPANGTSTASALHQHNKSPHGAAQVPSAQPSGPVGGHVVRGAVHSGNISALLRAAVSRTGRILTWRTPGSRAAGGVLPALLLAEAHSSTPAAQQRAQEAAVYGAGLPARAALPDRLLSVSTMGRAAGASWSAPQVPRCQQWVLVDLDDVQLPAQAQALGLALAATVRTDSEASGRCAVIRTSPTGVQVWVELQEARHSAAAWHQLPDVRAWHAALGARLLSTAREHGAQGGHADASACAAGRFGRRPGWRLVGGVPYRAHLLCVSS